MSSYRRFAFIAALALLLGAAVLPTPGGVVLAAEEGDTGRPTFSRVLVLVLENQSYDDLVGNRDAPFINNVLERDHASATRFFSPYHNSPADYFSMSSGRGYSKGDGGNWAGTCMPSPTCSTDDVSVFQQLNEAGKRWRVYSQDQQTPCQIRNSGKYWVGHNPAVFYRNLGPNDYTDTGNGTCVKDDVPWEELPKDIEAGTVPEFAFLIPNNCNNMHDTCKPISDRIRQGDAFLERTLAGDEIVEGGLIEWVKANDTLLVITVDDGSFSDHANCCPYSPEGGGGHIPTWVVGPPGKVKADGYKSEVDYSLFSILRLVETNFRLPLLGHAADDVTADMSDFFPSRLRIEQGAGVAGARAPVTGVDFAPDERVEVRWDCEEPGCRGPVLATVTADAKGGFATSVTIPSAAELGSHRLGASGTTSGRFGASSYTVRAPLTSHPTAMYRGGSIEVEGAGFRASETVQVSVVCADRVCNPTQLGTVDTDQAGAFGRTMFEIPPNTRNGRYTLRAEGRASGRVNELLIYIVEGIILDPLRGPSGGRAALEGRGFSPQTVVQIVWDCLNAQCPHDSVLTTATADASGDFETKVTIPAEAAEGNYSVGAIGAKNRDFARAWFKVKAPLALWPDIATPGRTLALSGAGFGDEEQVEIRWGCEAKGCDEPVIAVGEASDFGELSSVAVVVPDDVPAGTYVVGGTGLTTGTFAKAELTIVPRLAMSPSKGEAGWNVTLSGAGFHPNQALSASWACPDGDCADPEPATATADATGRAEFKVLVPRDSAIGSRILRVTADGIEPIEIPYQVVAVAAAAPAATTPPRSNGGSAPSVDSLGPLLLPALLVGLGLIAFTFRPAARARRR